jgi:regulator of sirC expression with transglutaminase-like and TPR domain
VGRVADDPRARFAELVTLQDEELPLDEALLLIASHADPTLDVARQRARLDELAAGVPEPSVEALRAHLYADLGFTGDAATYYDARNSMLPDVIDRRLGIPLSLAALTLEVGRRCGVGLEGIGMPGHFLVRPAGQSERYLDPFHGGAWIDEAGCRALFELSGPGVAWDPRFLRPDPPWSMVGRTLNNLAGAYRRVGDRTSLCWVLSLRLLVPGATVSERRELGLLLGASGRFAEGAAILEVSAETRDHEAAARLRARLN